MSDRDRLAEVEAVVLAAGKGTRMKSDLPKVLHLLAGEPLLAHVLRMIRRVGIERTVVVVGHEAARVRQTCAGPGLAFVTQEPQLGTGHAVQVAAPLLRTGGYVVVLNGDVPLLRPQTVGRLIDRTLASGVVASVLTCVVPDAGSYGRIIKGPAGELERIVEARDATAEELAVGEYNTGVFCYRIEALRGALDLLSDDNDQGEFYLTDTIAHLVAAGSSVAAVPTDDPEEVVGINTVTELAAAEQLFRSRSA